MYAVEASSMAEYTRQLVKQNGCEEVVTVVQGRGEEIELPEKVDVLVSEWMGNCLVVNDDLKTSTPLSPLSCSSLSVCLCSPVWVHGGVGAVCQGPLAQGRWRDVALVGSAGSGAVSGPWLFCRKNGLLGASLWSRLHSPSVRFLKLQSFFFFFF